MGCPLIAKIVLVPAAALLLAGCWGGAPWYDAADAVTVLPDGSYRLAEPGSPSTEGDSLALHNQPDGTMLVTGAEHPWQGIAVQVDPARKDLLLLQLREGGEARSFAHSKAVYMLLDVQPQGFFVTILPCNGSIAEAVERAGGFIARDPQTAASCDFPDKATMIAQLERIMREPPRHDIELKRISS